MKPVTNALKELLFDSARSTADLAVDVLLDKPELLVGFSELAFSNEYPFDMRSSNVIEKADEICPGFAGKLVPEIINHLRDFKNDGPRRQFLRMLIRYTDSMDEDLTGLLYDACYAFACDPGQPIGIRHNAIRVLNGLCRRYPELKSEIVNALEMRVSEELGPFGTWLRSFLLTMNR